MDAKSFIRQFYPIRYYAMAILLLLGVYTWAELKGIRILGDDNQSKETRHGQGNFYHK